MDVLFDLENGIYLVPKGGDPVAVGIEIAINIPDIHPQLLRALVGVAQPRLGR
jgi:hypothetical protein